jgi:single-strand DNA-binding protein
MDGINRVTLLGYLGQDAELRFTQGGQAVLNLRMATTERYKDAGGEWKERTEWHSVVIWGKRGEALSKFLQKGSKVVIEGRLCTTSYEARDGTKKSKTEIVAQEVHLFGGGPEGERRERGAENGGGGGGNDDY